MQKNHVIGLVGVVALGAAILLPSQPSHIGPANAYPDPKLTPGLVATTDINELAGKVGGKTYSQNHRLTTDSMKKEVCAEYPENCKGPHEIDHFCPLALGCADDTQNLWAEPEHLIVDGFDYGFHTKDKLEAMMVLKMKQGEISPADAQQCILKDWVACYQKYASGIIPLGSYSEHLLNTDPDNE